MEWLYLWEQIESHKNLSFRFARKEDATSIARINFDWFNRYYRWMIDDEFLDSLEYISLVARRELNLISNSFEKSNTFIIVVEVDWDIKWFIRWWVPRNIDTLPEELYWFKNELYSFYMDLNYRWKWIWKKLLDYYKKIILENWVNKFFLWCLETNTKSRIFYHRNWWINVWKRIIKFSNNEYYEFLYRFNL